MYTFSSSASYPPANVEEGRKMWTLGKLSNIELFERPKRSSVYLLGPVDTDTEDRASSTLLGPPVALPNPSR